MATLTRFVEDSLIPDDGSRVWLENYIQNLPDTCRILLFPDVHYKKGARALNGTIVQSEGLIVPSMLGVENCGFSVAKLEHTTNEALQESFADYCRQERDILLYKSIIKERFRNCLEKQFELNSDLYSFLGFTSIEQLWSKCLTRLENGLWDVFASGLGYLGGGNHFFEAHEVVKTLDPEFKIGEHLLLLHSDSISFGDEINLLHSNLSELDCYPKAEKSVKKREYRLRQIKYFTRNGILFKNPKEVYKLLFSHNDFRTIKAETSLGKQIIFDHNLAYIFGEINRDCILDDWSRISGIGLKKLFSHAHDSITVEKYNGKTMVVQRNGVQYIGMDRYYLLPGAMGTEAHILRNTNNKDALFSANHGTGRMQDKHIARGIYTDDATINELSQRRIGLYRIGDGALSEQNYHAFKDVSVVLNNMEESKLGTDIAVTCPIAIIKG